MNIQTPRHRYLTGSRLLKTGLALLCCIGQLTACHTLKTRDSQEPGRPQSDEPPQQMVEVLGDSSPAKSQKPFLGIQEEALERENSDKTKPEYIYHYKISLQLRCTLDGRIEAPLRGQIVTWNWIGFEKSRDVTDTEGMLIIERRSHMPIPSREFKYEVNGFKGETHLANGPFTLVLREPYCKP